MLPSLSVALYAGADKVPLMFHVTTFIVANSIELLVRLVFSEVELIFVALNDLNTASANLVVPALAISRNVMSVPITVSVGEAIFELLKIVELMFKLLKIILS